MKSIVIEVCPHPNSYFVLTHNTQSAPTLLFTTVGLLFTGELLDHVAVSSSHHFHPDPTPNGIFNYSAGGPCAKCSS
jgi:hypothetical protein